jgi:hypothetical protein
MRPMRRGGGGRPPVQVQFLVRCSCEVEEADAQGFTALMFAAEGGHLEAVRTSPQGAANCLRHKPPLFFAIGPGFSILEVPAFSYCQPPAGW